MATLETKICQKNYSIENSLPECYCNWGYYRNESGHCVLAEDCLKNPCKEKGRILYPCDACQYTCDGQNCSGCGQMTIGQFRPDDQWSSDRDRKSNVGFCGCPLHKIENGKVKLVVASDGQCIVSDQCPEKRPELWWRSLNARGGMPMPYPIF